MKRLALILALAACTPAVSPLGDGMEQRVRAHEAALKAHPETPDEVGETGTDLIIFWDGAR